MYDLELTKEILKQISHALHTVITHFSESYYQFNNSLDASLKIDKAIKQFIMNTENSLKKTSSYSTFFKSTLSGLNHLEMLIEHESDDDVVIVTI